MTANLAGHRPVTAALWRYQDPYVTFARRTLPVTRSATRNLLLNLGSVGYTRTEMVELPGQFAVRAASSTFFSPESPRPVRIELLATVSNPCVNSIPTQRSIAPVFAQRTSADRMVRTPLNGPRREEALGKIHHFRSAKQAGQSALFELSESSLRRSYSSMSRRHSVSCYQAPRAGHRN